MNTKRGVRVVGAVGVALALAALTCTQRHADNPIDRKAVCDEWCERRGECFESGSEFYPGPDCLTVCVEDVAWEPCGDELLEQMECFNALTCGDFQQLGATEDAPCHTEVVVTSDCKAREKV